MVFWVSIFFVQRASIMIAFGRFDLSLSTKGLYKCLDIIFSTKV